MQWNIQNNQTVPYSINNDFESTNDIREACESTNDINEIINNSCSLIDESDPPQKPKEEEKSTDGSDDLEMDEFAEHERNSLNKRNIRDKIDLGYTTINYRTSLIPKVKWKNITMKKNIPQISKFDMLIMKNVKTSDPFRVTEILLNEVSRINSQIISAK